MNQHDRLEVEYMSWEAFRDYVTKRTLELDGFKAILGGIDLSLNHL